MGEYDAQIESEALDLDSLAWLAHPSRNATWKERGWYTAITFLDEEAPRKATDQAVDFACAVLHDIWWL